MGIFDFWKKTDKILQQIEEDGYYIVKDVDRNGRSLYALYDENDKFIDESRYIDEVFRSFKQYKRIRRTYGNG